MLKFQKIAKCISPALGKSPRIEKCNFPSTGEIPQCWEPLDCIIALATVPPTTLDYIFSCWASPPSPKMHMLYLKAELIYLLTPQERWISPEYGWVRGRLGLLLSTYLSLRLYLDDFCPVCRKLGYCQNKLFKKMYLDYDLLLWELLNGIHIKSSI